MHEKHLPNRSIYGLQKKAAKLGLTRAPRYIQPKGRTGKSNPWTDAEVEILRQYYGKMQTWELHEKYLTHRSVSAITGKAQSLAINSTNFTKYEIDTMRQFYGNVKPACLAKLLPDRPFKSIYPVVKRMGHASIKYRPDELCKISHPRNKYSRIQKSIAIISGLTCKSCNQEIRLNQEILICPECAGVFCLDCKNQAEMDFSGYHA